MNCPPLEREQANSHLFIGQKTRTGEQIKVSVTLQKPNLKFRWTEWLGTSAKSKTRKVLVKYIVIKEIPSYKWVVVKPQPAGGESDVPPPPPTARLPQSPHFDTVVVPAGTKLPPLPRGITPDQVRGVVFQGKATPAAPQRRPQATASQPRLILR